MNGPSIAQSMNGVTTHFFEGTGEMVQRTRDHNWTETSLGPINTWPQSLLTTLSIVLHSRFPMFLFWGPEHLCFYNDAYRPSLGNEGKHPTALGKPGKEIWPEIWDVIFPLIEQVLAGRGATWSEDQLIPIFRNGKIEDAYWTFSYSPVIDESGKPSGVFVTCTETTEKVMNLKQIVDSSDQLHFAIEATELGTWDYNPATNKFSGNSRLKEWFGLESNSDIDLGHAIAVISPADQDRVTQAISTALAYDSGGQYDIEYTIQCLEMSDRIVRARGRAWFDDQKVAYRFNGTLQDVTAQALARKQIENSEFHFRQIADTVPVMLWITEKNGYCSYLNKLWFDVTGQQNDEALGFGWLDATHPDDKEQAGKAFTVANENKTDFQSVYRLKTKRGEYRWVIDIGRPKFVNGSFEGFVGSVVDIHDQKLAEEEKRRLAAILETSDDFVGLATLDLKMIYVNPIGLSKLGWNNFEGRSMLDAIHPDDRDYASNVLLPKLLSGKGFKHEIRFLHASKNEPIWFLWNGIPILDPDTGEVKSVATISPDITEIKKIQQALKESEQRFQAAVDAVHGNVWTNTAEGKMEGVQPGWSKLTGQSYQEYAGYGWATAVHPDDAQPTIDAWNEAVRERKTFIFEHRLRTSNGEWRSFSIRAIPLRNSDGTIREWVGVHTDITEERKAQMELAESEERFRIMADASPNIVWALNPDGSQKYLNKFAVNYLGITLRQALDMNWEPLIHPDDLQSTSDAVSFAISNRRPYSKEHRLRRHDGEYRWFLSQGEPSYYKNGDLYGYVGSGYDIHEWKLAEAELRQNEKKLEELVKDRTKELERSNEDLLQFAHVASHDLKEPIRKIQTFTFRLHDEISNMLTERPRVYIDKILNAAARMNSMVEGVLQYSSINAAENVYTDTIDLTRTIQSIEDDLEVLIQQKSARIQYTTLHTLTGSSVLIYQLFYNLINNSLKFSKTGVDPVIEISSQQLIQNGKDYLKIDVVDNGIGFEPAFSLKIFDSFSRLNSKDKFEGTGLGLALCKKIAERHRGTIEAIGEKGKGALFRILLPVMYEDAAKMKFF